jgi:hypothetical protein
MSLKYLRVKSKQQAKAGKAKRATKNTDEALRFGGVISNQRSYQDVGVMMADHELLLNGVGDDDDIFVYTGGEQQVPRDVKRVRIAENIDTIPAWTFRNCQQLIEVEGHNKLKKIKRLAFYWCTSLRTVTKMTGVIEIEYYAFCGCSALSDLEFDKLEIIGIAAFAYCDSLESVNMPSIGRVGRVAFQYCDAAFQDCIALRRIAIPLKDNLSIDNHTFSSCENLSRVDALAGGMYRTISSLHMESWRDGMVEEIDSINQTLPSIRAIEKADAIQQWVNRVLQRMEHYKSEHQILLKEVMALLEMALWKAKLLNEMDEKKCNVDVVANTTELDTEAARKEHRVTCGANIVIKNVLPFLALK